jgi:SNF2 family DNA or RNA helicase
MLADEMGLGKTVQAAIALRALYGAGELARSLIVTPASLRLNWKRELDIWAPELATRLVGGPARDRSCWYILPVPVLIASYEQIREDVYRMPEDVLFDVVVLDEAQRIKNKDSSTALSCRLLRRARS